MTLHWQELLKVTLHHNEFLSFLLVYTSHPSPPLETFSLDQPSNTHHLTLPPHCICVVPLKPRRHPSHTYTLHITGAQLLGHGLPWESCLWLLLGKGTWRHTSLPSWKGAARAEGSRSSTDRPVTQPGKTRVRACKDSCQFIFTVTNAILTALSETRVVHQKHIF